jgi:sporulation protein YlmC with PRC-barrel domain
MAKVSDTRDTNMVMPVQDLHGRVVWSEDGERLGVVRDVISDDDGRINALKLRGRWMLGSTHEVPASGMRMEGGDVHLPMTKAQLQAEEHEVAPRGGGRAAAATAPVLLSGRDGARGRYGGIDPLGSFFGALVALASLVLIGGALGAIFSTEVASYDTSISEFSDVGTEAAIIGGVTLFLSFLLGGWAAGRSSRFDGVANGMLVTAWFLAIVLLIGGLASWVGSEWNLLEGANLPEFVNDDWALAGAIGVLIALALMLLGGVLGGMLGEGWHRRADRAMMDVVEVQDANQAPTQARPVQSSMPAAPPVDSTDSTDSTDSAAMRGVRRSRMD